MTIYCSSRGLLLCCEFEQGLDKKETVEKHGKDQVQIWRRSYTTPPPLLPDDRWVWYAAVGNRCVRYSPEFAQDRSTSGPLIRLMPRRSHGRHIIKVKIALFVLRGARGTRKAKK